MSIVYSCSSAEFNLKLKLVSFSKSRKQNLDFYEIALLIEEALLFLALSIYYKFQATLSLSTDYFSTVFLDKVHHWKKFNFQILYQLQDLFIF